MENMKQFYSRFRVMLLTFTLGLAVVPFSNTLYEKWSEILVDLPKVESEVPIVVMVPTERKPFNMDEGGGGSGGSNLDFRSDCKLEKSIGRKAEHIPKKKSLKYRRR